MCKSFLNITLNSRREKCLNKFLLIFCISNKKPVGFEEGQGLGEQILSVIISYPNIWSFNKLKRNRGKKKTLFILILRFVFDLNHSENNKYLKLCYSVQLTLLWVSFCLKSFWSAKYQNPIKVALMLLVFFAEKPLTCSASKQHTEIHQ